MKAVTFSGTKSGRKISGVQDGAVYYPLGVSVTVADGEAEKLDTDTYKFSVEDAGQRPVLAEDEPSTEAAAQGFGGDNPVQGTDPDDSKE